MFQLAQIAQGIIQGMEDIKATGMKACPEHNKNIMVNINDFKDVVLIDLDDIVKCNRMNEREIMEQLENIFISCKRLESIFNYPLEGLKLKLDIKKFDDLSKKILFPKKISQLSARKFQPKISAELTKSASKAKAKISQKCNDTPFWKLVFCAGKLSDVMCVSPWAHRDSWG